jgi:sulfite reductase alpha subunit-like flavoprotein
MTTKEGEKEFKTLAKTFVSVLDILERFDKIEIEFGELFQILPRLIPRYYTIASSSMMSPHHVRIAISLT